MGGRVYDGGMTEVFLRTTANKAGYVAVRVRNATGEVVLTGALSLLDRRVEMVPHADGVLGFEPLSNGTWLLEVRANGATVLYGKLLVLPSPIDAPPGNDSWEFTLDAAEGMAQVDAVLNQGPVGPRGETGAQGPQGQAGLSAYELAVAAGYEGSEEEWVAELQGAQDAANAAKSSASEAAKSARAAADSEEAAAKSATAAADSEEAAAEKAALLGDAALCSGDNVFDGGNVFNGPLAVNGPLDVTGDFAWGGFPVGWQEDFWLASHGTNPKSKVCKSFSEWMEMNPDWAKRRRLLVYIPALDYDDSKAKIYDNITPEVGGVCEECVYVGKCISYEENSNPDACWQAFGSKRWFVFSTTNVFRGFGGLRTVEEFTAFLPWVTTVSAAGVLDNLGKDAAGCVLRLYAPICTNVYTLFKRCFWTELVLDMPLLDSDFEVGYKAATSSHAVPVVKLAQVVRQLPVRSGADVRTVTAYVPAAEVAADAAVFEGLVADAAGKNWSLVYVEV